MWVAKPLSSIFGHEIAKTGTAQRSVVKYLRLRQKRGPRRNIWRANAHKLAIGIIGQQKHKYYTHIYTARYTKICRRRETSLFSVIDLFPLHLQYTRRSARRKWFTAGAN